MESLVKSLIKSLIESLMESLMKSLMTKQCGSFVSKMLQVRRYKSVIIILLYTITTHIRH